MRWLIFLGLYCTIAFAGTAGLLPGSFDPPTLAHRKMMEYALGRVDRLTVMVNSTSGPKDYFASFEERKAMVQAMLKKDRLDIVEEPAGGHAELESQWRAAGTPLLVFLGEDVVAAKPQKKLVSSNIHYVIFERPDGKDRKRTHPEVEWVKLDLPEGISSSRLREALFNKHDASALAHPEVLAYIAKQGLYRRLSPEEAEKRKKLYLLAYSEFTARRPEKTPAQAPPYVPEQSPGEWEAKFLRHTLGRLAKQKLSR